MKKSIILRQLINNTIVKGGLVRVWDGSSFSVDGFENLYIVESKPEIFGTKTIIKELIFEVVETNVINSIIEGGIKDSFYRQDLILKLVNSDLNLVVRSASELVRKINLAD